MPVERLEPIPAPLYDPRHEHDACGVGFVADIDGRHAARTVPMALEALAALAHRGARGADDTTGDGAGISIPISPRFRRRLIAEAGVDLGPRRRVAVAMCFLPPDAVDAATALVAERANRAGLAVVGWRACRWTAASSPAAAWEGRRRFGRPCWCLADGCPAPRSSAPSRSRDARSRPRPPRPRAWRSWRSRRCPTRRSSTRACSSATSSGASTPICARRDLDARYAIFHQRYSTNTFPSWRLAQPFTRLAHNGEINTIRANREHMRGRRSRLGGVRWARRLADARAAREHRRVRLRSPWTMRSSCSSSPGWGSTRRWPR